SVPDPCRLERLHRPAPGGVRADRPILARRTEQVPGTGISTGDVGADRVRQAPGDSHVALAPAGLRAPCVLSVTGLHADEWTRAVEDHVDTRPEMDDLAESEPGVGGDREERLAGRAGDRRMREEVADFLLREHPRPGAPVLADAGAGPGVPGQRRYDALPLGLLRLAVDRVPPERAGDHAVNP